MLEELCMKLTNKIHQKHPKLSEDNLDVINFFLLVLFGEVPKIIMILLIAWWFGILKLTLITFVAMSIYRVQSGGFHLSGHISCFLFSLFVFCGIGLAAQEFESMNNIVWSIGYVLSCTFNIYVAYKYAPADTEQIPVINEKLRKSKKIRSIIAVGILYIVAIILFRFHQDKTISNICIIAATVQSVSMLPISYKLSKCEYGEITKQELGISNT